MKSEEKQIHEKIRKARTLYLDQKYGEAASVYRNLTDILSDDKVNLPIIKIELGWSYYYNQEYLSAISELTEALKSDNLDFQQQFDCLRIMGFSYSMTGDLKKAQANLKSALALDIPESGKRYTYFELGKILFTDGEIIESEHYMEIAETLFTEEEPEYRAALSYYLGFAAYLQKKFTRASKLFNYILTASRDPKTRASGYFGLAHLHFHKKEFPVVIDICEKIMRMDNTFFDKETLGYFLSSAYLKLKMWNKLEMFFSELEKNYPQGRYASEYPKFKKALQDKNPESTN